jgi:hypothetical protein
MVFFWMHKSIGLSVKKQGQVQIQIQRANSKEKRHKP